MLAVTLGLIVALIGGLNAWISVRLLHASSFERKQKFAQFFLIWLIPILGAAVVYSVIKSDTVSDRSSLDPLQTLDTQNSVTWGDYSAHHHNGEGGPNV